MVGICGSEKMRFDETGESLIMGSSCIGLLGMVTLGGSSFGDVVSCARSGVVLFSGRASRD